MNKNLTPLILLVIAVGIYFTFTRTKLDELKEIKSVNSQYQQAIDNSEKLTQKRDAVKLTYDKIDIENRERLEKMLPDNVDNVRLIIDVNGVAARHGLLIKNVKTSADAEGSSSSGGGVTAPSADGGMIGAPIAPQSQSTFNTVKLSFTVNSNYQNFVAFLRDLEASLRIMDVSKITLTTTDTGIYDYTVELETYWLKK